LANISQPERQTFLEPISGLPAGWSLLGQKRRFDCQPITFGLP